MLASSALKTLRPLASRRFSTGMEKVSFGEGNFGYRIGDKSAPAVVVLQEWWGVTDEVKKQAAHLSRTTGYQCLVPDLYKGSLGVTVEEANHSMENLDFPGAVKEICDAAGYLQENGAARVGVTGFCMGGALSLLALQHCDQLVCAAPFYGTPGAPSPFWDPELIGQKPVQMHFGENDGLEGFSDPATAQAVCDKLTAAGVPVELFIYPGVGHGFMNSSPWPFDTYEEKHNALPAGGFVKSDETQQSLAWDRIAKFFQGHLN